MNNTIEKLYDVSELSKIAGNLKRKLDNRDLKSDEVINGIAYDSKTKDFYLTGKNWNVIFNIAFN